METFKGRVVCPRCDGNGLVYKAKIGQLDLIIYVCDECEACWEDENIRLDNFQDLSTFLESKGLTYDEAELYDLGYDWWKESRENVETLKGIVCPLCDGNGLVYKAKIGQLDLIIYVCDECESCWEDENIRSDNAWALYAFLESKGLTYDEAKLYDLGYDWWRDPSGVAHPEPVPNKTKRSVFNVDKTKVSQLLDEAWTKKGQPLPNTKPEAYDVYVVPMGRVIGTDGETAVKLIVKTGTSELITAYPVVL